MPSEKEPIGRTRAHDAVVAARALDQAIQELADVKRSEWRPRQNATVARRLGRFADGITRNSQKPPPAT